MKKIFYSIIVAGLALVSAACQKLDEQKIAPDSSNNLTVTASIVNFDGTKVSYAFSDPTNVKSGIKPSWVTTDQIFGFDENGNTFTFPVSSIDPETGKATFDASQATGLSGKLYAVYYPGKDVSYISSQTLEVDLSSQSGKLDGSAPVIMCATGEIKDNAVNFAFTNQTAIVGIYKMQVFNDGEPVGAEKTVTAVTLNGARAKGEIKVEGGVLTLVPGTEDPEGITASGLSLTTDTESSVNVAANNIAPYFAVIPDAEASLSIDAVCDGSSCKTNAAITGKINAGQYYYLGKKVYGGTVATIGTDQYATISEAFAAANDGEEIKLQNDCTFDSQITLANKSGEITLDLNGYTLKNGPTLNNKQSRIYLNEENATLVIRDSQTSGKIVGRAPDQDVVKVIKGNLTVASGTIEAPSGGTDGGNAAIWVEPATSGASTAASVTIQGTANIQGPASFAEGVTGKRAYALYVDNPGAIITVEGGTFSSQSNNLRINNANSVNITGGTFESASEYTLRFAGYYTCNIGGTASVTSQSTAAVYVHTDTDATESVTLNVTGGKYKITNPSSQSTAIINRARTVSPIYVTGGLFSKAVSANYIPNGYHSTDNTDPDTSGEYPFKVEVEGDPVVSLQIGSGDSKTYPSLEAAVGIANGADQNCTITLIASEYTLAKSAEVSNTNATVTLDLAGKTLKQDGNARFGVTTGGTLIITDSSSEGTGTLTQSTTFTDKATISIDAGSLVIQGGTITQVNGATVAAVLASGTANVTVSGGEILATSSANDAIQFSGSGDLTISGGEVTAVGTTVESNAVQFNSTGTLAISDDAIVENGKRTLYVNNGTINITGGTISNNAGVAIYTYGTNKCALTISDGTITSQTSNAVYCTSTSTDPSTVTVSGGKFKRGGGGVISKEGTCTSTISVTGGLFNVAPNSAFIDGVHAVADNQDETTKTEYPKTVVEQEAQVTLQIGTGDPQNYSTVEGAINKANQESASCTIKLLNDEVTVNEAISVTNSNGVTLDLNGKTLVQNGSTNRIGVASEGKLTIVDNKGEGKIKQTAASNIFNISAGTLTISGGEIYQEKGATAIFQDGGNIIINGGKINVPGNNYALQTNSGTVNISDGEIVSNGSYTIYVNNTGTKTLDVDITGGTIKSVKGEPNVSSAVYIIYINAITENSSFDITGGQFKSNNRFVYSKDGTAASVKISNGTSSTPYFYTYNTTGTSDSQYKPFLKQSSSAAAIVLGGGYYGCAANNTEVWAINNCSYAEGKTSLITTHTGPDGLIYKRYVTDKNN